MCGQSIVYNIYATLANTNLLFLGFSCSLNVLKEIGFYCILEYNSIRFITPQNFGSGVFFYVNGDKINIIIIDYQNINQNGRSVYMTTVSTKSGRIIKVVSREEEKRAYVEYANGERKYAE